MEVGNQNPEQGAPPNYAEQMKNGGKAAFNPLAMSGVRDAAFNASENETMMGNNYIPPRDITPGNLQSGRFEEMRADNQHFLEQSAFTLGRGILGIGLSAAEGLGAIGELGGYMAKSFNDELKESDMDWNNGLMQSASDTRNDLRQAMPFHRPAGGDPLDLSQSSTYFDAVTSLIESVGGFALVGGAVGRGFSLLGKAGRAAATTATALGGEANIAARSAMGLESAVSANAARAQLIEQAARAGRLGTGMSNAVNQMGTASFLAYTEGALSGRDVYADIVQRGEKVLGAKYPDRDTDFAQQDAYQREMEDIRHKAGVAGNVTVGINTFLNTGLNWTSAGAFSKTRSTRGLVSDLTNPSTITLRGALRREALQEGLEEQINVGAEAVGRMLGSDNPNQNWMQTFLGGMFSKEGLFSAALGVVGGVGQTALTEGTNPASRMLGTNTIRMQNDAIRRAVSEAAATNVEVERALDDAIQFTQTSTELQDAHASGDENAIRAKTTELVNQAMFRSFRNGTTEHLVQTIENKQQEAQVAGNTELADHMGALVSSVKEGEKRWLDGINAFGNDEGVLREYVGDAARLDLSRSNLVSTTQELNATRQKAINDLVKTSVDMTGNPSMSAVAQEAVNQYLETGKLDTVNLGQGTNFPEADANVLRAEIKLRLDDPHSDLSRYKALSEQRTSDLSTYHALSKSFVENWKGGRNSKRVKQASQSFLEEQRKRYKENLGQMQQAEREANAKSAKEEVAPVPVDNAEMPEGTDTFADSNVPEDSSYASADMGFPDEHFDEGNADVQEDTPVEGNASTPDEEFTPPFTPKNPGDVVPSETTPLSEGTESGKENRTSTDEVNDQNIAPYSKGATNMEVGPPTFEPIGQGYKKGSLMSVGKNILQTVSWMKTKIVYDAEGKPRLNDSKEATSPEKTEVPYSKIALEFRMMSPKELTGQRQGNESETSYMTVGDFMRDWEDRHQGQDRHPSEAWPIAIFEEGTSDQLGFLHVTDFVVKLADSADKAFELEQMKQLRREMWEANMSNGNFVGGSPMFSTALAEDHSHGHLIRTERNRTVSLKDAFANQRPYFGVVADRERGQVYVQGGIHRVVVDENSMPEDAALVAIVPTAKSKLDKKDKVGGVAVYLKLSSWKATSNPKKDEETVAFDPAKEFKHSFQKTFSRLVYSMAVREVGGDFIKGFMDVHAGPFAIEEKQRGFITPYVLRRFAEQYFYVQKNADKPSRSEQNPKGLTDEKRFAVYDETTPEGIVYRIQLSNTTYIEMVRKQQPDGSFAGSVTIPNHTDYVLPTINSTNGIQETVWNAIDAYVGNKISNKYFAVFQPSVMSDSTLVPHVSSKDIGHANGFPAEHRYEKVNYTDFLSDNGIVKAPFQGIEVGKGSQKKTIFYADSVVGFPRPSFRVQTVEPQYVELDSGPTTPGEPVEQLLPAPKEDLLEDSNQAFFSIGESDDVPMKLGGMSSFETTQDTSSVEAESEEATVSEGTESQESPAAPYEGPLSREQVFDTSRIRKEPGPDGEARFLTADEQNHFASTLGRILVRGIFNGLSVPASLARVKDYLGIAERQWRKEVSEVPDELKEQASERANLFKALSDNFDLKDRMDFSTVLLRQLPVYGLRYDKDRLDENDGEVVDTPLEEDDTLDSMMASGTIGSSFAENRSIRKDEWKSASPRIKRLLNSIQVSRTTPEGKVLATTDQFGMPVFVDGKSLHAELVLYISGMDTLEDMKDEMMALAKEGRSDIFSLLKVLDDPNTSEQVLNEFFRLYSNKTNEQERFLKQGDAKGISFVPVSETDKLSTRTILARFYNAVRNREMDGIPSVTEAINESTGLVEPVLNKQYALALSVRTELFRDLILAKTSNRNRWPELLPEEKRELVSILYQLGILDKTEGALFTDDNMVFVDLMVKEARREKLRRWAYGSTPNLAFPSINTMLDLVGYAATELVNGSFSNPYRTAGTEIKKLADWKIKAGKSSITHSVRLGKVMLYIFNAPFLLRDITERFKQDDRASKERLDVPFASTSSTLDLLHVGETSNMPVAKENFIKAFSMKHLHSLRNKSTSSNPTEVGKMTEREREIINFTAMLGRIGLKKGTTNPLGLFVAPTLSDKERLPMLDYAVTMSGRPLPKHSNPEYDSLRAAFVHGDAEGAGMDALLEQVFTVGVMSEVNRMQSVATHIEDWRDAVRKKDTKKAAFLSKQLLKGYHYAKSIGDGNGMGTIFVMFPALNDAALLNSALTVKEGTPEFEIFKVKAKERMFDYYEKELASKKEQWVRLGIITEEKVERVLLPEGSDVNSMTKETLEASIEEIGRVGTFEYWDGKAGVIAERAVQKDAKGRFVLDENNQPKSSVTILDGMGGVRLNPAMVDKTLLSNLKTFLAKQGVPSTDSDLVDYVVWLYEGNYDVAHVNFRQMTFDPAIAGKPKVKDGQLDIATSLKATWDNVSKRNAAAIAPGYKGRYVQKEYLQLVIADEVKDMREGMLAHLREMKKEDGSPWYSEEEMEETASLYKEINSADAQEYITVREALGNLLAYGRIDKTVHDNALAVLQDENATAEQIMGVSDVYTLLLNPEKPVSTAPLTKDIGSRLAWGNEDGTERPNPVDKFVYVKSSAMPLIPFATKGTEIDGMRRTMETLERKTNRPVRAAFESAVKLGIHEVPRSLVELSDVVLHNALATMDAEEMKTHLGAIEMVRDFFYLQQDTDSALHDDINQGVQAAILILQDWEQDVEHEYEIGGHKMKSPQVLQLYMDAQKNLLRENYRGYLRTFQWESKDSEGKMVRNGISFADGEDRVKLTDLRQWQKKMLEEVRDRNMGTNAENSYELTSDQQSTILPDALNPFTKASQTALLAEVNKKILKATLPGTSGILASEAGWLPSRLETNVAKDKNFAGVQWTREVKEELAPDEIIMPWIYGKDEKEKWELWKQFVDGKLDVSEMSNLFGYRIPTGSLNAMSGLKVVGYLPPIYGSTTIPSKAFTVHMGSDFDVDKLYIYRPNFFFDKEENITRIRPVPFDETIRKPSKEQKAASRGLVAGTDGWNLSYVVPSDKVDDFTVLLQEMLVEFRTDSAEGSTDVSFHFVAGNHRKKVALERKIQKGTDGWGLSGFEPVSSFLVEGEELDPELARTRYGEYYDGQKGEEIETRKIATADLDPFEMGKRQLENLIIALMTGIIQHPSKQKAKFAKNGSDNLARLADEIRERGNSDVDLSGLGSRAQMGLFLDGQAGKTGVSVFSVWLTSTVKMQLAKTFLKQDGVRFKPETGGEFNIGNRYGDTYNVSMSELLSNSDKWGLLANNQVWNKEAWDQARMAKGLRSKGKPYPNTTVTIQTPYASDLGRMETRDASRPGGARSLIDTLAEFQSAAVDNAKNLLLNVLNLNNVTFRVAGLSLMSGFDERHVVALLDQPILREYVSEVVKRSDKFRESFAAGMEWQVANALMEKYSPGYKKETLEAASYSLSEMRHMASSWNPVERIGTVAHTSLVKNFGEAQADILLSFMAWDRIARNVTEVNSNFRQDSAGLGISVAENQKRVGDYEKLASPDVGNIQGLRNLFYGWMQQYGVNLPQQLFSTNAGGKRILDQYAIPYQQAVDRLADAFNRKDMGVELVRETYDSLTAFFVAQMPAFTKDAALDRSKLVRGKDSVVNQWLRIQSYIRDTPLGRSLEFSTDEKGNDVVEFNNRQRLENPDDLTDSFFDWLTHANPEVRKFGESLVRLSFLNGVDTLAPGSYHKLIPTAWLKSLGLGKQFDNALEEFQSEAQSTQFLDQFVRNFPQHVPQLSLDSKLVRTLTNGSLVLVSHSEAISRNVLREYESLVKVRVAEGQVSLTPVAYVASLDDKTQKYTLYKMEQLQPDDSVVYTKIYDRLRSDTGNRHYDTLVDLADKESHEDSATRILELVGGRRALEVARYAAKSTRDDRLAFVLSALSHAPHLESLLRNVTVTVRRRGETEKGKAFYDPRANTVVLYADLAKASDNREEVLAVIAEEIIHALLTKELAHLRRTDHKIWQRAFGLRKYVLEKIEERMRENGSIDKLRTEAPVIYSLLTDPTKSELDIASEMAKESWPSTLKALLANPELYALVNVDEFLAQSLSNDAFKEVLRGIERDKKVPLLRYILQVVRDIFGFGRKELSASHQAEGTVLGDAISMAFGIIGKAGKESANLFYNPRDPNALDISQDRLLIFNKEEVHERTLGRRELTKEAWRDWINESTSNREEFNQFHDRVGSRMLRDDSDMAIQNDAQALFELLREKEAGDFDNEAIDLPFSIGTEADELMESRINLPPCKF